MCMGHLILGSNISIELTIRIISTIATITVRCWRMGLWWVLPAGLWKFKVRIFMPIATLHGLKAAWSVHNNPPSAGTARIYRP